MEKRLIIFLILSVVIMFFYPYILRKLGHQPITPAARRPPTTSSLPAPSTRPPEINPPMISTANEVTVETDLLKISLSMQDGTIRSWELKKYLLDSQHPGKHVQLVYQGQDVIYPLSLIPQGSAMQTPAGEQYTSSARQLVLDKQRPTGEITLNYTNPATGEQISKRLTFHNETYWVNLEIEASGLRQPRTLYLGTDFGIAEAEWGSRSRGFSGFVGPTHLINGEVVHDYPNKITRPVTHKGPIQWSALQDKYFLAAFIPQRENYQALVTKEGGPNSHEVTVGLQGIPFGEKTDARLLLYAGPKEYDALKALGVHLEETIDFGWFIFGSWVVVRMVAQPLFAVLRFLDDFTHNYGVAIILLTVIIRILFIPLTHKSYKSMKAMQTIQPKVAALQKKYKDNKEQLNKEMLELYRQHKVNPFGGCLPSILQVPVFVALFNILYTTIDLRQAPFMFWIHDLSEKDPSYVLPILMGATMVLQQKLQPSQMDPKQARLMLLMPVFLTVLFLSFPSGLVLYWITNNLLSIGQQVITMKYFERSAHEPAKV
jgi:YidC/Oxa1 family membrane protein insertase